MKKKLMAAAMAAVMTVAVQAPAFAATSDPNMTAYLTDYTTTVSAGTEETVYLMAVPADAYYSPTSFDSEADAADVAWSVVPGSTTGVSVDEDSIMGMDMGDGTIAAYAEVNVAADAAPGAASIEAKNPETGATMNYTVVVNGTDTAKNNITYRFYNGDDELLTVSNMSVAGTDYYGNTSYPSVLDGVLKVWQTTQRSDKQLLYPTVTNNYGTYAVESMTFRQVNADGSYTDTPPLTNYTDETTWDYYGWQYRVYRNGTIVPLSELIGADECALQSGDTVVWKFGQYGVVDFDDTL